MARDFNGATDRIDYAGAPNLAAFTNLTMAARVYRDAASDVSEYMLSSKNSGSRAITLWFTGSGLLAVLWVTSGTALQRIADAAYLNDDVWNTVVVTHVVGLTASNIHIYVNGSEVSYDFTINGSGALEATDELMLGGRQSDDNRNFDGKLADVVYSDTIWSASEIAAYNAGYSSEFFPRGRTNMMPLIRSIHDVVGGIAGSADGTTVFNHPRIIYPSELYVPPFLTAAPSGLSIPIAAHHYRQMQGVN